MREAPSGEPVICMIASERLLGFPDTYSMTLQCGSMCGALSEQQFISGSSPRPSES